MPDLPLPILEALVNEPRLTGPQAAVIGRRVHVLQPEELEQIRTKSLLFHLAEAGGRLRDAEIKALDRGCLTITRAKEAGWIHDADWTWSLTPEGRRMLDFLMSQADSRNWDRFVLDRLGESLLVTCPTCKASLAGLWLQPTMGCPSCHHRFRIEESPTVTVHDRLTCDVPLGAESRKQ